MKGLVQTTQDFCTMLFTFICLFYSLNFELSPIICIRFVLLIALCLAQQMFLSTSRKRNSHCSKCLIFLSFAACPSLQAIRIMLHGFFLYQHVTLTSSLEVVVALRFDDLCDGRLDGFVSRTCGVLHDHRPPLRQFRWRREFNANNCNRKTHRRVHR